MKNRMREIETKGNRVRSGCPLFLFIGSGGTLLTEVSSVNLRDWEVVPTSDNGMRWIPMPCSPKICKRFETVINRIKNLKNFAQTLTGS